jgi:enoyl-CoA hydratase
MTDPILFAIADGLCTLMLNRPDKLNALSLETFRALDAHLDTIAERQTEIGCILLRGAGRSFCAGHDLGDLDATAGLERKRFETGVIERLAEIPMPVVAAVQGHCMTGGLELALAADIIIAAETARFADTHGKWDLVPIWGMSQRLPRRIGPARAAEMMYAGRAYTAAQAAAMGLVNFTVPDAELDREAQALATDICANAWRATRAMKTLLRETDGMTLRAGIAYELHHTAGRGPEMDERIARFTKRK